MAANRGAVSRRTLFALLVLVAAAGATAAAAIDGEVRSVGISVSSHTIRFGARVTVAGSVTPSKGGVSVLVEQRRGTAWAKVGTATTSDSGAYRTSLRPARGGSLRARLADPDAVSAGVPLHVKPLVRVSARPGRAFLGAPLSVRVKPRTYSARVHVRIRQGGRLLAVDTGRVRSGLGRFSVPTPGIGRFRVRVTLPAANGLEGRTVRAAARATARTVGLGSTGRDVGALVRRLAALRIHTPAPSTTFGSELFDTVTTFQKAEGLPRTGLVTDSVWRALGRARPPAPRYARPRRHIEVDKTRQILMVVEGGKVSAVLPVSTGATGNTPEGAFRIRWKALATTTWLGPAILYRTLTFYENSIAIHGFPSVPVYPASHGCVRIPMWAADWLYQRSPVGERVYVYH